MAAHPDPRDTDEPAAAPLAPRPADCDRVFAQAYAELQGLARLARRRLSGGTLDTTGLVHECYLRLRRAHPDASTPGHFLAIAAQAMRHLLIERARARSAAKRGSGATRLDLDADEPADLRDAGELLELDDLLRQLGSRDPQQVAVIECRFFAGLSDADTAAALGMSLRTVQRQWSRARDWLATHWA